MDASLDRVYHYHAASNAIGGVITHPYEAILSSEANSALANAGGQNSSKTEPVHLDHIIHVDRAYTHVSGGDEDTHWATLTTSVLEGVNLMEVVTADKIVGQISSKFAKDGDAPVISFVGSQFINLRINGHHVHPVLDLHPFPGASGYRGNAAKSSSAGKRQVSSFHHPEVRKLAAEQSRKATGHKHAPDWVKKRYGWLESADKIDQRGHLTCSLVKEIQGGEHDYTFGHVIHVPGFGNVFLAEVSCDSQSHHLVMLRAEMGCASSGTISMAAATTNGRTVP